MFFLSKDARKLFERLSEDMEEVALRIACDQAVMMYSIGTIETLVNTRSIFQVGIGRTRPKMADYAGVALARHLHSYRYITEQFVTHDFSRIDLLKMASAISMHEFSVVKQCGDRCKNLKHFTIPYLVSVLDNEATEIIETIRRDARIEDAIRVTPQINLPTIRPTNLIERFTEFAEDRKIDDALKGKN